MMKEEELKIKVIRKLMIVKRYNVRLYLHMRRYLPENIKRSIMGFGL